MTRALIMSLLGFFLLTQTAQATEAQEVVSPGGVKAWLVEEHSLPLIAVKIAFTGAGFAYDETGKKGRSSLTAAMLMEGAGDMRSREFNEALENDAIQLDFATDEDLFRASLESLSENKEKAFSYLGLALTRPRFDSDALERAKSQTLSVIAQEEEEPGYILHRGWQQVAFPNHPYSNPPLGDKDDVAKLGVDNLREFARRYLTRGNMLVAVVGDITPQELSKLLDANLAGLPQAYDPDVSVPDVRLPGQASQTVIKYNIPQTMAMFGTQGIKRDDPDYYAAYVMNQMLGGGGELSARLAVEIREKRGLAYSVYSQLDPMLHGASWRGSFATRNAQVGDAVGTLRATLKDFAAKGPSDQELADAKKFLTGSFVLGLDSDADVANYLISMEMHHLGRDYFDKRNSYIDAVRKEDVARMAKTLVDPERLLVVMVGEPALGH